MTLQDCGQLVEEQRFYKELWMEITRINSLSTILDLSPRLIVEEFYNRWNKIGLRY